MSTSAAAGTNIAMEIREGSTTLSETVVTSRTANDAYPMSCIYVVAATAASHTYKLSCLQTAAGTATVAAGATAPAFILVELI